MCPVCHVEVEDGDVVAAHRTPLGSVCPASGQALIVEVV